jgi:hypothetical protein
MSRNRLVIVAALAGIAVLAALTLPIQTFLTRFLEWVDGLGALRPHPPQRNPPRRRHQ